MALSVHHESKNYQGETARFMREAENTNFSQQFSKLQNAGHQSFQGTVPDNYSKAQGMVDIFPHQNGEVFQNDHRNAFNFMPTKDLEHQRRTDNTGRGQQNYSLFKSSTTPTRGQNEYTNTDSGFFDQSGFSDPNTPCDKFSKFDALVSQIVDEDNNSSFFSCNQDNHGGSGNPQNVSQNTWGLGRSGFNSHENSPSFNNFTGHQHSTPRSEYNNNNLSYKSANDGHLVSQQPNSTNACNLNESSTLDSYFLSQNFGQELASLCEGDNNGNPQPRGQVPHMPRSSTDLQNDQIIFNRNLTQLLQSAQLQNAPGRDTPLEQLRGDNSVNLPSFGLQSSQDTSQRSLSHHNFFPYPPPNLDQGKSESHFDESRKQHNSPLDNMPGGARRLLDFSNCNTVHNMNSELRSQNQTHVQSPVDSTAYNKFHDPSHSMSQASVPFLSQNQQFLRSDSHTNGSNTAPVSGPVNNDSVGAKRFIHGNHSNLNAVPVSSQEVSRSNHNSVPASSHVQMHGNINSVPGSGLNFPGSVPVSAQGVNFNSGNMTPVSVQGVNFNNTTPVSAHFSSSNSAPVSTQGINYASNIPTDSMKVNVSAPSNAGVPVTSALDSARKQSTFDRSNFEKLPPALVQSLIQQQNEHHQSMNKPKTSHVNIPLAYRQKLAKLSMAENAPKYMDKNENLTGFDGGHGKYGNTAGYVPGFERYPDHQKPQEFITPFHSGFQKPPPPPFPCLTGLLTPQQLLMASQQVYPPEGHHFDQFASLTPAFIHPDMLCDVPAGYFYGFPPFIQGYRNLRRSGPSNELHIKLEECYDQFRNIERERKKTEAELARQHLGKKVSSMNNIVVPRLPSNPSRVDRLVVDSFKEHARILTLIDKMETLMSSTLHPNIHSALERWLEGIRKVQARRKEEIVNATNRNRNGGPRYQEDKDVLALASSIGELTVLTRRARTTTWCALQISDKDNPVLCKLGIDARVPSLAKHFKMPSSPTMHQGTGSVITKPCDSGEEDTTTAAFSP